jgi:uncharacterized protein (DUF362 family)
MSIDPVKEKLRNLLLVFILLVVTVACAFQEGYLAIQDGNLVRAGSTIFWTVLFGGSLVVFWLALSISTKRLVALVIAIILVEYCNQTLGTKLGLWKYPLSPNSYFFAIMIWVFASLFAYAGAWKAVVRLTMKSIRLLPKTLNPVIPIVLLLVIWFTGPAVIKESSGAEHWYNLRHLFWLFFAILLFIGTIACIMVDFRVVAGVIISAWIVGFISESAGGCGGLWKFPLFEQDWSPPVFLVVGCWPLEILAQFALSAWLAGEPLIPLPDCAMGEDDPKGSGMSDESPVRENSGAEGSGPEAAREVTARAEGDSPGGNGSHNQSNGGGAGTWAAEDQTLAGVGITDDERNLKAFLRLSAFAYLVVGFIFLLKPEFIVALLNDIGTQAAQQVWSPILARDVASGAGHLQAASAAASRFWVTMTFSMMMAITFLAYFAQRDVRKNKHYVVPLLLAKASSALSAFMYFVFVQNYFPFLAIFVVDGIIFWLTLYFFLGACSSFFETQTTYFRKRNETNYIIPDKRTTVASFKGEDKIELLDRVLEATDFFGVLQRKFEEVKQKKAAQQPAFSESDFSVAIKPNFMFTHAKEDRSTYTDPELVEHLVDRLCEHKFSNIKIVESQATLGNHYDNRDVANIARVIGYTGATGKGKNRYQIRDLTLEKVRHNYKGKLGWHWVGESWRDADFRISFGKNKTHVFCGYTLTIKNVYGTLPLQDKLKHYHTEREYDWPTIESMKPDGGFPVHFGLIDAYVSGDGQFGVLVDPEPNLTKTIIGGENIMAVDWVGCTKMGMDPDDPRVGRFYQLAVQMFGRPQIDWVGDTSVYEPWENVTQIFIKALDIIEEDYHLSFWGFGILSACSKDFPFKGGTHSVRFFRWALRPFKRMYYKYDVL